MSVDYLDIHTHGDAIFRDALQIRNVCVGEEDAPVGQFYSAGIHPWYILNPVEQQNTLRVIAQSESCLLIGECGLDKLHGPPMSQQENIFRWHVQLSEELKKPLIIHCVKAFDRLLTIKKSMHPKMPWIIHGFQGKAAHYEQLIRASCLVSFGADILNPKRSNLHKCLRTVDLEHIFIETDESSHAIHDVYREIAQIRGIDIEELKRTIQENFKCLF